MESESTMRELTDYFSIIDCLGGYFSGDYYKDLARANKNGFTFSREDYFFAYQISVHP